jgi:hypothetical protein
MSNRHDDRGFGGGRHGALHDQERVNYGGQGYGRGRGDWNAGEDLGYGSRGRDEERETWRPDDGAPYGDLELNPRNRGVQEYGAPADYAYHPHAGHEFDTGYLRWRDEQMRRHDRDYEQWRRSQSQKYDEDYRTFREARRDPYDRG